MEGNLLLERQSPIGGLGPPLPRGGGPRDYVPPPASAFFHKAGPPPPFQPPQNQSQAGPNGPSGPPATSQSMNISRSPRLLITPSSPDNVGPALGRLGRSIGLAVEMLATVGETIGEENPDIRGDMQVRILKRSPKERDPC